MSVTNPAARFLSAAFLAFAASGTAVADTAADIAALEAVDKGWEKAFATGNADAIAAYYDEQAVLLPPFAPAVTGRAAIKDYLKKEMDGAAKAGVAFVLGPKPAGGVSGNMGWQSGTYAVKDKSGKVLETGKYLSVSMKKGGKWLYVRDTWNPDAKPAPAMVSAPAPAPVPMPAPTPPPKK